MSELVTKPAKSLTEKEIKKLQSIARKYEDLENAIAECYEEGSDADLCTIGEIAATKMGYLI